MVTFPSLLEYSRPNLCTPWTDHLGESASSTPPAWVVICGESEQVTADFRCSFALCAHEPQEFGVRITGACAAVGICGPLPFFVLTSTYTTHHGQTSGFSNEGFLAANKVRIPTPYLTPQYLYVPIEAFLYVDILSTIPRWTIFLVDFWRVIVAIICRISSTTHLSGRVYCAVLGLHVAPFEPQRVTVRPSVRLSVCLSVHHLILHGSRIIKQNGHYQYDRSLYVNTMILLHTSCINIRSRLKKAFGHCGRQERSEAQQYE